MSNQPTAFTDIELAYLASQRLGRLATVASSTIPVPGPGPARRTSTALDEAFERLASAGFELPNGFVNHGATATELLVPHLSGPEVELDEAALRALDLSGDLVFVAASETVTGLTTKGAAQWSTV